jgi:hypothetical protein
MVREDMKEGKHLPNQARPVVRERSTDVWFSQTVWAATAYTTCLMNCARLDPSAQEMCAQLCR